MNTYLNKLLDKKDLTISESKELSEMILRGELTQSQIAAILIALAAKGESVDELTGFIKGIKIHMVSIDAKNAVDVCGTGGDGKNTFNISSAVALIVAAAGVAVAKHGNSAVSSNSGSADVMKALGVNIALTPEQAEEVLSKTYVVFLFAPLYHPTFKNVGTVRKELGVRTIFNYLGPLINPAQVKRQIVGVPSKSIAEKLAQVARNLHYDHLVIVSSEDGMDEISITDKTYLYEIKGKRLRRKIIDPIKYGFKKVSFKEFIGGSSQDNARIIMDIVNNKKGPKRDIVVFNSAFALYVAGRVKNIEEGIELAEALISEGKPKKVLESLVKESQKYV